MSTFTSRINAIGEFSVGNAKFIILDVRGGMMRIVQTHDFSGGLLDEYALSQGSDGRVNIENALDQFPHGFVVPQNHPALDSVRSQIADLDSRVLTICATCNAAGVTLQNFDNACTSCQANYDTIAYLKTV